MPSSFKGSHGKIVYMLEAKLSRSWRMDSKVQEKFNFVSKSILNIGQLMAPQVGAVEKELGLFSKKRVQMDVTIDRRAYAPGEKVSIIGNVKNSSSKKMKPKFTLEKKVEYRAGRATNSSNKVICKMVGLDITPKTEKTISCSMEIPADQAQTILNCDIISVEYFLKVYLDISFAFDPEVKFPLVIVPAGFTSILQPGGAVDPYPAGAFGGPSNSDFPPPAASMESSPHLSTYPALPQNPAQPPDMSGGYNNPFSQQASPSGYPFSVLSSSSVHHEPPTGPLMFNPPPTAPTYNLLPSAPMMNTDFLSQRESPSYMSIPSIRPPQVGSVEKELLFSKGQVQMAVTIDRRAVAPGEKVAIIANVKNSSSKKMKPKFILEQKVVYRVKSETKSSNNAICKLVGNDITPKTEKTISCSMKIPADLTQTILNCEILSVEYFLKVYLDISFAFDPEVKFPLVIVPAGFTSIPQPGGAVDPYPDGAFGGPSNSDFPPPAASMEIHDEPPTGPLTFNPPPTAPTYNLPSSDPMMNTDFLSQ
ncbi:uncharacterized protein ACJ7VT_009617 [Polymixia lowei]